MHVQSEVVVMVGVLEELTGEELESFDKRGGEPKIKCSVERQGDGD